VFSTLGKRCSAPGLALAAALWLSGCAPSRDAGPAAPGIDSEVEKVVAASGRGIPLADTIGLARTWRQLDSFYRERRYRPVWSNGRVPRGQARQMVRTLRSLAQAGLDTLDYNLGALNGLLTSVARSSARADSMRIRNLARFEVIASYGVLRAAEHLRNGRMPKSVLDPDWVKDTLDARRRESLMRALGRDPAEVLEEYEPRHQGYRLLRAALIRYREIAAAGGWGEIPAGPPLEDGSTGPRVAAVARRLEISGDWRPAGSDTVFDRRLQQAVGDFQTRLGIPRSGVVGEATRQALNLPVEHRIRQMELNLERWRWLPDTLGMRHVEINIPAYRLTLVQKGKVTRAMRVVVGKRRSPTPVFSDKLTYMEINPTWTLPPSVVAKEIVPAYKKNRDYFETNHMRVISIANSRRDTLDPRQVPWKDAASDSFPFLVVQDAGPENPLGQVKIMCPNEYDVYLHDSPQRSRFSVAVRDYSHGCVRVEHAAELADSLLELTLEDSVRVDSLAALGAWKRVRLPAFVPVHFLYWTAWADEAGRMSFREDVYGLDQRLDAALRQRTVRDFDLNPGVELSPFWVAQLIARGGADPRASRASGERRVESGARTR